MCAECNNLLRDFENDSQLVLGLDTGRARCGLARADASLTLASPHAVIETEPRASLAERVRAAVGGRAVRLVVAGLPLDQHGSEGEACVFARQVAGEVSADLGCSLEFIDERFTTAFAERSRSHTKKGVRPAPDIDAWAAAAILQAWLDQRKSGQTPE